MATLLKYLKGAKPAPDRVPTDKIIPVHFFDDNATLRGIVMAWVFRFDDVIDQGKVEAAVSELFNIPSWRHLGGRLRLNRGGKLEIHVPEAFTADRPGVRFSRTVHAVSMHDHPVASKLPTTTTSLQPGPLTFKEFGARPDAPSTLEDYLYSDEPQIAIHFTSFTDATLIALSFPHTMSDAMGISSLMSGISLVLAGRKDDVPNLPDCGVLDKIGLTDATNQEPYVLADQRITGLSGIMFGVNFAKDMFMRPKVETRNGYLSAAQIQKLRTAAEADIVAIKNGGGQTPSFLSDGDILTAWGCRNILQSEPHPVPAIILNVLNVRNRFPSTTGGAYIQNLTFNSNTLLSASEGATSSLGHIAARVRQSLIEQTSEAQLEAIIRESRISYSGNGNPPLFGPSNSRLLVVSNWDKAKMFEAVDFSFAVVKQGDGAARHDSKKRAAPGRLVYHHAHSLREGRPVRNFWNIIGKDLEGGCWYSGTLLPESWQKIEEALAEL